MKHPIMYDERNEVVNFIIAVDKFLRDIPVYFKMSYQFTKEAVVYLFIMLLFFTIVLGILNVIYSIIFMAGRVLSRI